MVKITALLHTHNDGPRIGRALESLRVCDEVLVIDHGSTDNTVKLAREHGATVKDAVPGVNPGVYVIDAHHDWILCLLPTESISEALEASLFEWKQKVDEPLGEDKKEEQADSHCSVAFMVREETGQGWKELGVHTRLANRKKINWPGHLPHEDPTSSIISGHLLRFQEP
jgi:glycosyltransferase involved in cell wall biosynthesis